MDRRDYVLYVDFDSTLNHTKRFRFDLWQLVGEEAGVPATQVADEVEQFFADKRLGGYQFSEHIKHYNLDEARLWQRLEELCQTNDYLFDDSVPFIRQLQAAGFRPHILSFGEPRFQTIKIKAALGRLSPKPLPFTVITEPKNVYIARTHPEARGALIDDVPNQQLPTGFTEIHIDRALELDKPLLANGVYEICILPQAMLILEQLDATS